MRSGTAMLAIYLGSALAVSAVCLAAIATVSAAERFTLRPAFREGERWNFQQSGDMQQSSTMTADGQPQGQMRQRLRQNRKGIVAVLAVRDGLPVSIRITFDSECGGTMETAGQQQPVPFPFAGQTLTVTRDATGQVQHDFKGQADPAAVAELAAYLPIRDYYPSGPVSVGDQWQPDHTAIRQQQQLGPQDRLEISCRLLSIKDQGGRRLAEVETTTAMTKVQGQMEMQTAMRGISLVDVATGNTLQLDVNGTSGIKGTQQVPDYSGRSRAMQMTGQGSSEMHLSVSPVNESVNALPTHAAPTSKVGGAPPEMPPAVPAKSFNGTFTDGRLTVTLSGAADAYTGVLLLGDRKFPVAARVIAGRLEGSFESDGQVFSFTATVEGDTLRLTSDGKSYELKRRAANPLGSAPASYTADPPRVANPLEQGAAQTRPQPTKPANAALKFTRVAVRDPGVNNIEAFSFLAPAGWRTEGRVQWLIDFEVQAILLAKITDPQTGAAVEWLPIQYFVWKEPNSGIIPIGGNWLGSIVMPPINDVTQFIQTFYFNSALRHLAGARIVAAEDRPNVAAAVAEAAQSRGGAKSARVRYDYTADGQSWEEDVFVTLLYNPMGGGLTFWSVPSAFSYRAPKGQLDSLSALMNTTTNTIRITPEWYAQVAYVRELFHDRMRQGIRAAGQLSAHIAANNAEIQQMFADSYRRNQESGERIRQSYTEYIRGVETYRDPYQDRQVQLPSGYSGVWVNRTGEYVLSNEAGFDPNVGSNLEWRRLDRAP